MVAKRVVVFRLAAISDRILHPLPSPGSRPFGGKNTTRNEAKTFCLLISYRRASRFLARNFTSEREKVVVLHPSSFSILLEQKEGGFFESHLIIVNGERKCRRNVCKFVHKERNGKKFFENLELKANFECNFTYRII